MMCARPCTPRLCGVGRGRRPRRPARTHRPPASSLCVRGAGGRGRPPLPCIRSCVPHDVCGPARAVSARRCTPRLCGVGRGRRPRRPARTHRPPASSLCVRGAGGRGRPPLPCIRPCAPRLRGPAHHGCAALVGADALGGPRGRIVLRRRPCACVGRAAEDVRPYHVYGPARHMMCAALRVRRYHVRASARVMARVCAVRGPGDAEAGNGGGSFRSGRYGRACQFPSKGRTDRH